MTLFTSCDDLFEPQPQNNIGMDMMYKNTTYAESVLGNAYIVAKMMSSPNNSEVATDDAVSNDPNNSYRQMATGRWTSNSNPIDCWTNCRAAIQYTNIFLDRVDEIEWAKEEQPRWMYRDRLKGEALGLRAIYMYYLLRSHGGFDANGNLLGVPIVVHEETVNSNFNVPRNTFKECYDQMMADAKAAIELLPTEYGAAYYDQIRARFPEATEGEIARVFGEKFCGRLSGRIIEAFISRASLLAASPAFAEGSGVKWADAADAAAVVLDRIGGIAGMDMLGGTWYCDPTMKDLGAAQCPAEVMWRSEKGNNHDRESDMFPPTLYGKGRINPTQNFVDAFPMENGYPVSDLANSGYNPSNPYEGRDPRLSQYVLFNGGQAGHTNKVISTAADGTTNDALNKIETSTRTGYYLKKLCRQDVNLDPSSTTDQLHYTAYIRFTEMFLNYAEAANEAWGPTGQGTHGYSAYDVIQAIRMRAGIGLDNEDAYLESVKTNKDKMRELIRNERRIELSFEGFRFYDLRRWKVSLEEINAPATGIKIAGGSYDVFDVDKRVFQPYTYYGPIPYSEVLKYSNLQQNAGW